MRQLEQVHKMVQDEMLTSNCRNQADMARLREADSMIKQAGSGKMTVPECMAKIRSILSSVSFSV